MLVLLLPFGCAGGPDPEDDLDDRGPPDLAARDAGGGAPAIVVLATVAGLAPEHTTDAAAMPVLAGMAASGLSADALVGVTPPTPYPVHATLATGQHPATHGVPADRMLGEHGPRAEVHSHASHLRSPTLWQAVVERGGGVLSLDWPGTVGASIPLLLPDLVVPPGRRMRDLLQGATTPALLEMAARDEVDLGTPSADRDGFLVTAACRVLMAAQPPRLVQLRLTQTAAAMGRGGPSGPHARQAFAQVDRELGRLLRCLADAERLESSAVVVVGDGAWGRVHSEIRPNRWLLAAGLIRAADAPGAGASSWRAVLRSNGGSAFLYANDTEAALEARRVLAEQAEQTGAFRVLGAEEMIALHTDPEAWFGVTATPGYALADGLDAPLLRASASGAAPGYLGGDSVSGIGLAAWGRGLRRGVRAPELRLLDVAPTLAVLLGVPLAEAEGRAQLGLLRAARTSTPGTEGTRWRVEVSQ